MPIYGYSCQACGFKKDCLQKMGDAPLVNCPACGKPEFSKQVSAPSFRLAGTGWYETDFNTGTKKNLAGDRDTSSSSSSD